MGPGVSLGSLLVQSTLGPKLAKTSDHSFEVNPRVFSTRKKMATSPEGVQAGGRGHFATANRFEPVWLETGLA